MHELDDPAIQKKVLDSVKKQLGVSEINKVGSGNEFYIYHAILADRPIVIKIPKDRIFSNVNDAHIDSKTLLDQEFNLMRHVQAHGIHQTPEPISDLEAVGFGAVVMSYVQSDDSEPDQIKLGQLLARIHSMPAPSLQTSAQEGCEIPELIGKRLHRRWIELLKFEPDIGELPTKSRIINILEPTRSVKQLLHMDFRRANFRMKDGEVIALLDWSNALVGHPALELARAAETGETDEEFLQGYSQIRQIEGVDPIVECLFRLDTATMLALVFLSENPDPELAVKSVKRVRELYAELRQML